MIIKSSWNFEKKVGQLHFPQKSHHWLVKLWKKFPHWHFWSCFHTPTSKTLADIEKFSHTSFFLKICHFLVEPLMFVPDGFSKKKSWATSNLQHLKLLSFLQISICFGTDVKLFGYCNYTNFHNYLNLPQIPLFSQNYGYSGNIHMIIKSSWNFEKKLGQLHFCQKSHHWLVKLWQKIPHWHFWSCFHTPTSKTLADIEKFRK